ncbi:PREDICTED: D-beta-hydroxybutyrate dehydrogenase, mitochondrial-like [Nanorana parkeri]|uniref:D-beta-hydroxybutyrate dehydrogenase, mitochondrial-like n=1 Tax=Nanorana parkeri TaxID=125878 RepID=UPI000854F567|nr:PREDICTED: D-beta-hydroxybutyrate dehydrogenase, mitochondrial-like [Nanorana parkeri]
MALHTASRSTILMVLISIGLTVALGFGLPEILKLIFRLLGFPIDNASHAIVLVYFVFVMFVAMPSIPRGTLPLEGKAVLITGCDKGFGFALAKHLHKLGFQVFAGCLLKDKNGEGAQELENVQCDRMKVLQMNVCSDEEVANAVEFVNKHLEDPEKGLWGLVNNAGIATFGEVEFTSLDTYKETADVNLWGTIRVTKAVLPLIRRSKGRVVCMASMLGRMGSPSRSSYCISKYGVEAFSDCLRQEMYKWGVKVITIEPGNFIAATGIFTKEGVERRGEEMWEQASEIVRADYGRVHFSHQVARMKAFVSSGVKDMTAVLNGITDALCSKYPYTRYNPTDTYYWIKMQLMSHLPAGIADWIYIH